MSNIHVASAVCVSTFILGWWITWISSLQAVATSMCSGKKTPRAAQLRANKENMELNGSILSGGYSGSTPLQHNCSIKSVASTYSEFSVIHLLISTSLWGAHSWQRGYLPKGAQDNQSGQ